MQNCRSFLPQAPKFAAKKNNKTLHPQSLTKMYCVLKVGCWIIYKALFEGGGNTPPKTNKKGAISIGQHRLN